MYVVVGWIDGFGADTIIKGLYQTKEEAVAHCDLSLTYPDKITDVDFGEWDIDYYDIDDYDL